MHKIIIVFPILLLSAVLSGCGITYHLYAAGMPEPDERIVTGTTHGYNLDIWHCFHGKRVVIYRYSSEFTGSTYSKEEASCDELTAFEKSEEYQKSKQMGIRVYLKKP